MSDQKPAATPTPTPAATPTPTLRTQDAAAYLNIQPATLCQWRWNGRGPLFCRIGRNVRYRQKDLDDFMDARVFASTSEARP
jgi:hypothetical protein